MQPLGEKYTFSRKRKELRNCSSYLRALFLKNWKILVYSFQSFSDTAFRIFDEDDDGAIHAGDLVEVLTNLGDKLSKSEARKLVQHANKKEGGLIDYKGKYISKYFAQEPL